MMSYILHLCCLSLDRRCARHEVRKPTERNLSRESATLLSGEIQRGAYREGG